MQTLFMCSGSDSPPALISLVLLVKASPYAASSPSVARPTVVVWEGLCIQEGAPPTALRRACAERRGGGTRVNKKHPHIVPRFFQATQGSLEGSADELVLVEVWREAGLNVDESLKALQKSVICKHWGSVWLVSLAVG